MKKPRNLEPLRKVLQEIDPKCPRCKGKIGRKCDICDGTGKTKIRPKLSRKEVVAITQRAKNGRGKNGQKKIRQKARELEKNISKLEKQLDKVRFRLCKLRFYCFHPSRKIHGCVTSKTKPVFGWICYDCGASSDPLIE